MFFYFVTCCWFIQNQIKSHTPSSNARRYTQVGLLNILILQYLF